MSSRDSRFDVVPVYSSRNSFGVPTYTAPLLETQRSLLTPPYIEKKHSLKSKISTGFRNAVASISGNPIKDVEKIDMDNKIKYYKGMIRPDIEAILTKKKIKELIVLRDNAHAARLAYYKNDFDYKQGLITEQKFIKNKKSLKEQEDIAIDIEKKAIDEMKELIDRAKTVENTRIIYYLYKNGEETSVSRAYKKSGLIVDEIKKGNNYVLDDLLKQRVLLIGGKRLVAKRPIKSVVKRPTKPVIKRPTAKRPLKKPTAVRAKRPVAKRPVAKRPVRAKRA
jgi:hypothetical protein